MKELMFGLWKYFGRSCCSSLLVSIMVKPWSSVGSFHFTRTMRVRDPWFITSYYVTIRLFDCSSTIYRKISARSIEIYNWEYEKINSLILYDKNNSSLKRSNQHFFKFASYLRLYSLSSASLLYVIGKKIDL